MGLEFEQLPKESAKAFAAFSLYLGLGPERSVVQVAKKLQKSEGLLRRWATRFDWAGRVAAYDAHMAEMTREAAGALVAAEAAKWLAREKELRDQTWDLRAKGIAVLEASIKRFLDDPRRCSTAGDIARLLDVVSILGHRATGTPLERVEVTGADGGPIRLEFEAAVERVYGKQVVEAEVISETLTPHPGPLPAGEGTTKKTLAATSEGGGQ